MLCNALFGGPSVEKIDDEIGASGGKDSLAVFEALIGEVSHDSQAGFDELHVFRVEQRECCGDEVKFRGLFLERWRVEDDVCDSLEEDD